MSLCNRCAKRSNSRIIAYRDALYIFCDGVMKANRTLCTDFVRKEKDKVKR